MNRIAGRVLCLAWLLVLPLPKRASAGEAALPVIVGAAREQITADDVRSMVALAQPLVAAHLTPVKIVVSATDPKEGAPQPERAEVYFAPFEADGRSWRGYYLHCESAVIRWLDQDPAHWRKDGGWQTLVSNGIKQYIVSAPRDKALVAWPAADVAGYYFADLHSELETGLLLDLIEAVRGYSMSQPDGSELAMASLTIHSVSTHTSEKNETRGQVVVYPPPDRPDHRWPINVRAAWQERAGWQIVSVDRMIQ